MAAVELSQIDLIKPKQTFIVAFVNSKSGGQHGTKVYNGLLEKITPSEIPLTVKPSPKGGKKLIMAKNRQKTGHGAVHDLALVSKGSEHLPENVLRKHLLQHPNLRIIVCGGDGTMCWILNSIASLNLSKEKTPPMSMMPLGTGNDLSRMYGWGKHFHSSQLKHSHLQKIHTARPEVLDLWCLKVTMPSEGMTKKVIKWLPPGLHKVDQASVNTHIHQHVASWVNDGEIFATAFGENNDQNNDKNNDNNNDNNNNSANGETKTETKTEIKTDSNTKMETTSTSKTDVQIYSGHICNYMSIGMTARGAMLFHQEREKNPARFTGSFKNKVIYASKGCGMCCGDCGCHPDVRHSVSLEACSASTSNSNAFEAVPLTSCGVMSEINILNIQSYSGGVVKTPTSFPNKPSPGDGILEVVGLGGYQQTSAIVGLCMCCCVSPMKKIMQASAVRLTIQTPNDEPIVAQFDGEPFFLPSGSIVELTKDVNPVLVLSLKKKK